MIQPDENLQTGSTGAAYAQECIAYTITRRIEILSNHNNHHRNGQRISAERARNFEKFRCQECGLPHAQMFLVHDEVWALAGFEPQTFACYPCFVRALPRPLVIEDFKQCLLNEMFFHAFALAQNTQVNYDAP